MTDYQRIDTVPKLRKAIKEANIVLVQVRFGVSEKYVKLSKIEARALIDGLEDDATPEDCEIFGGSFGRLDRDGMLWLS